MPAASRAASDQKLELFYRESTGFYDKKWLTITKDDPKRLKKNPNMINIDKLCWRLWFRLSFHLFVEKTPPPWPQPEVGPVLVLAESQDLKIFPAEWNNARIVLKCFKASRLIKTVLCSRRTAFHLPAKPSVIFSSDFALPCHLGAAKPAISCNF